MDSGSINKDTFEGEELVASDDGQKNWKGMGIALFVITAILSCVAVSVVMLTPDENDGAAGGEPFSIQHILDSKFAPRKFNGSWISGSELSFRDASEGLSILDVNTLVETQIVSNRTFRQFNAERHWLSPSRKYLLLKRNSKKRYRFSAFSVYTLYEIATGVTWDVSATGTSGASATADWPRISHAAWLPARNGSDAGKDGLVFVENYSVYLAWDVGGARRVFPLSPVDDVVPEVVMHGVPDWIYEEDILKQSHAVWLSGDGLRLAYATFNASAVSAVRWTLYGDSDHVPGASPYPKQETMRYPKAGSRNPTASLWMVDLKDLSSLHTWQLKPPATFAFTDHYLVTVGWTGRSSGASVVWMNRVQNVSIVAHCAMPKWKCIEAYRERAPASSPMGVPWSTLYHSPLYSSSSDSMLLRMPAQDGAGLFLQVAKVPLRTTTATAVTAAASVAASIDQQTPLTLSPASVEVVSILGWDEQRERVYFLGIPIWSPSERHFYATSSRWSAGQTQPECLTCPEALNVSDARECKFNNVRLSPSFRHYVLECNGPRVPASYLVSMEWNATSNATAQTEVRVLDDNGALSEVVAKMAYPRIEKFSVATPDGRDIKAKLYLPPELVRHEDIKYPLVLHVYAGPGSQLVTDEWKVDFNTYLVSKLGYVVLEADGSGASGRGLANLTRVKRRLGHAEIKDQITAVKYVVSNLKYVDPLRVAVTGVSYGGYAVGMILTDREGDNFKCGVAVSPVVDWKLYETAYTERYMGLPTAGDNYKGYDESSLLTRARFLQGKDLLLVHGVADRNVHFQHSMVLAKELIGQNVAFKQQVYPDEGHLLDRVRSHLYATVTEFLQNCFYVEPTADDVEDTDYWLSGPGKGHVEVSNKDT